MAAGIKSFHFRVSGKSKKVSSFGFQVLVEEIIKNLNSKHKDVNSKI